MNPTELWKNFKLGDEISISGAFVYDGMRRFHEMRQLDHTDEVFRVLYDLSVGLERLLKIAVVLLEHRDGGSQAELEQSLITHSHLDLLARVKKHTQCDFGSPHNDLLQLLSTFYKSLRYDRFMLGSVYNGDREVEALTSFLSKHLSVELKADTMFGRPNDDRYRRFIRRTVLKIARRLYEVIEGRATDLNLYTYELRHGSKAESVFLREVDVSDEDVLWKELLIFLMNTPSSSGYLKFLRGIKPLDFDPALVDEYLDCFQSDAAKALVIDELEHLYTELQDKGERLEMMKVIGAPNVYFDDPEDELDAERS